MKKRELIGDVLKKNLEYFVAFFSLVLFLTFSLTGSGVKVEYSLYDTLLTLKPEISERPEVLLVDIDDPAIEEIGAWPWSRDVVADVLIRMKEAGGTHAVFDIEYLTPGQAGVNRTYVRNEFPAVFAGVHDDIIQYVNDFTGAVAAKNIPVSYVPEVGAEMTAFIDQRMTDLSGSITGNIFRDNDEYFANALAFFGYAYLTINTEKINSSLEAKPAEDYARAHLLFTDVSDPRALIREENRKTRQETRAVPGIAPAILPLLGAARGAGFPNVIIDSDGIRRRIPLLVEHEGGYVAQLVFDPILDILKPERIIRTGNRLILKNALDLHNPSSGIRKDIDIPLDESGRFMINWLKKNFSVQGDPAHSSFRHLSIIAFRRADQMEEKLIDNLGAIEGLGIKTAKGYLSYRDAVIKLRASYRDLETWKKALLEGKRTDSAAYFDARKDFFAAYGKFLDGGYDIEIYETFDRVGKATGNARYAEMKESIRKNFGIYRDEYTAYQAQVVQFGKICAGSFCIIGASATGTTDLGVNPFWTHYPNVGTHANIYNTIMTGDFITPVPLWQSWLVALVLCYISALAFRRIKSLKERLLYGIGSSAFVFVAISAVFIFFRVYVQMLVPLWSVFVTFLLISILRFMFSEQEKSFLRKAFTMYLSSDVVNQIVADPSLLKLGGQEKQITALFTDIKSFSTLSEKVTPEHLVQILNKYLTVMSDIVLDQKGTIDKYIGDAIVSFFGAPLDLPDHASRACLAAVRMKEAEAKLNEEMLATGESPMPIYTRIGINTGAMVVGNMGTDNKMNYTIMGNDVNLAARLEGVNKQYGSWILVSESTWKETGGMFLGRKLDRVRVVGIETPVQLYNILSVRAEASGKMATLVDRFNQAIDAYREKRFADALLLFTKCTEIDPDDAASGIFLDRVKEILHTGVPADWSDVINMTTK